MESFGIFVIMIALMGWYGDITTPPATEDPTEIVESTE
jgi:hypothetical protein|tara:strand:+ start:59 stop:172 length:114 start_codon:yes stop_codon:yes gene_type:complete